ncbi:hypothetical protein BKA63DRAFT_488723 [Paraphoma chrysanthemicola]|nr:hypothetical protein BKA63DRAFT_488723 [Paraphoma chrysanthemicola]
MPPIHPQTTLSSQARRAVNTTDDILTTYILLVLAMVFIPGLCYTLTFAWDWLANGYNATDANEFDDLDTAMMQRRPLSADRIDEYMVNYRPELLVADALSSEHRGIDSILGQNNETESNSDCCLDDEKTSILDLGVVPSYGSMDTMA